MANKNGHWYTDKNGNHYFVEEGQSPREGWEASKRRKMISGGKYKVSEDGSNWEDVDEDTYNKYEADKSEFDETTDDDFGFDEEYEANPEVAKVFDNSISFEQTKERLEKLGIKVPEEVGYLDYYNGVIYGYTEDGSKELWSFNTADNSEYFEEMTKAQEENANMSEGENDGDIDQDYANEQFNKIMQNPDFKRMVEKYGAENVTMDESGRIEVKGGDDESNDEGNDDEELDGNKPYQSKYKYEDFEDADKSDGKDGKGKITADNLNKELVEKLKGMGLEVNGSEVSGDRKTLEKALKIIDPSFNGDPDDYIEKINSPERKGLVKETLVAKFNDAHLYNDGGKFQLSLGNGEMKEFDTKNEAIDYLEKYSGRDYSWAREKNQNKNSMIDLETAIKNADDDVLDEYFGKDTPERKLAAAIKGKK